MELKEIVLQILQDKNMDETTTDEDGNTLLHQILLSESVNKKEIIQPLQLLLDRGVDPNMKDASENAALHLAVEKRMKGAVDLLIERGARQNVTDKYGNTIAHHFVENEYFECIRMLCEEPSAREENEIEGANFAEFMISRQFDFIYMNKKGRTALHWAASCRCVPHILLVLLEHAGDIDLADEDNRMLLHLVLANGRLDPGECEMTYTSRRFKIVKLLLDRGVPIVSADKSGRTVLHAAVRHKEDMSVVKMIGDRLLEACQNSAFASRLLLELVSTCSLWDNSGTDYFFKLLRALIAKGANVNVKDKCGRSPIHFAAECKALGCPLIDLLLSEGCDVNTKDKYGYTALHWAAFHLDNASVVRRLVECGCDVNAKDDDGNSALHFAARHPRNVAVVRMLLESGAVVNCKNQDKQTPLHLAVENDDGESIELTELLLENGANVNSRDAVGRTALSYDVSKYKLGMLKVLLRSGACVNVRDKRGITALISALSNGSSATVEKLLEHGADINDVELDRYLEWPEISRNYATMILKLHCIKLKAAQLRSSVDFEGSAEYRGRYDECLKEIETLKDTFIDSRTSLYDFLHMDFRRRCTYVKSEKLQNLVDSPVLEQQFPLYAALILASYREVIAKKLLLEKAKEAWLELTEIHLPDICIERILDYLSNDDLIDMADRDE